MRLQAVTGVCETVRQEEEEDGNDFPLKISFNEGSDVLTMVNVFPADNVHNESS